MIKVYGNTELTSALHSMVESGRLHHAILLHEDDGGGALPIALNFLEELYGGGTRVERLIHPDVHFVYPVAGPKDPVSVQFIHEFRDLVARNPYFYESELYSALGIEGKQVNISVCESRGLIDKLSLSAVEGGYVTVVMYLPEKMNAQAANALLKLVEEPPAKTLFLMITHAPEKVLTTISSRCLHMRVRPLSPEEDRLVHQAESEEQSSLRDLFRDMLGALIQKDLLSAIQSAEAVADIKDRERQKSFCALASDDLRNIFLLQQGLDSLCTFPPEEESWFREAAGGLRKSFPRLALAELSTAKQLLERNVNQKILFTDFVGKLYMRNQ